MLRRRAQSPQPIGPAPPPADSHLADGAAQALDQVAQWVRFADAKATILTAGLGVVLTMLLANSKTIAAAVKLGCPEAYVVGTLAALAGISAVYTLWWLLRAIGPDRKSGHSSINRFAWPSLVNATEHDVASHNARVAVSADAWRQVIVLSRVADRKFIACDRAIKGFGALVMFTVVCTAYATAVTS